MSFSHDRNKLELGDLIMYTRTVLNYHNICKTFLNLSLMVRRKQSRYTAAVDEPLLIQEGKDFFTSCKGRWREEYFHNNNPIVLELACGRGEYTV